jgi:hypothetical protein
MKILKVNDELYEVFYETEYDENKYETLKDRYAFRDPQGLTLLKGNNLILVCSKISDTDFEDE